MSTGIFIRQCITGDAETLAVLAARTFYETFTGTCTEEDMQSFLFEYYDAGRMKHELEAGVLPSWFAVVKDVPAGYISFAKRAIPFPYDGDAAKAMELVRLYVDKEFQGKGVAQALMDFYLQRAEEVGCDYLWLGVWEYNYRAQKFYSKYGFASTGFTHPFPIGLTPQTDQWWARRL